MPWFNVDDGSHSHPKVLAAGNAAWGLFCRLGAYSAAYSTEGRIPVAIVHRYGSKRERELLMTNGLLELDRDRDEYVMHDFLDYNRDADQIARDRARAADRQRRKRDRDRDADRNSHAVTPENSHAVTHARQAKPSQAKPSELPLATAAAARVLPAAAAAAVDLLINHRLATEPGIRAPQRYAQRVRADIVAETPELYAVEAGADPVAVATDLLGLSAAQAMTADFRRRNGSKS